ncbi:hypothetical protein [uncultured Hymenobacter sp.]|uniref:hypothetical protein n=1 Tax=uncultured Hymenobacter sp. TaxID=170016 RepID=UPI0035C993CE
MMPTLPAVKDQLLTLAQHLSAQATWDDVLYEIYVLHSIERGLADVAAGRTIPAEEVKEYMKQRMEMQRARSLEQ